MQDQIYRSRSGYQKKISLNILIIVIVAFISSLWINPFKSLLTLLADSTIIYHLFVILSCSFYVLSGALCISSLLVYFEECKERNIPVLFSRVVEYLNLWTGCSFILVLTILYKKEINTLSELWDILLPVIGLTMLALCVVCLYNLGFDYDDVDVWSSQKWDTSIGALWAVGAYKNYYKLTLEDIIGKIQTYEKEHNVHIPVKKLFILCPLSCNVNGSLDKKDDQIFKEGQLKVFECDQGANINRRYKHTVYKIPTNENDYTYVVAEYASPLGTLWGKRFSMNEEKLKFHRNCLIQSLKDLLKTYPCVVLEYDDKNPAETEPLHRFLFASIQNELALRQKFNNGDKSQFV